MIGSNDYSETLSLIMLRCVQTICVSVRERPRMGERVGYVLSARSVYFILLFTVFICLASVVVGFGYFSVIRPVMQSRELPRTMFAVRFPDNNCTPQNVRQPIRCKHSMARRNIYIYILVVGRYRR